MDWQEIKELLQLVDRSQIEEVEIDQGDFKVRVRRFQPPSVPGATVPAVVSSQMLPAATGESTTRAEVEEDLYIFKAPLVGTFYSTPKPDAEPFVKVGDFVTKNTVLCIIEAMKIFNQIESDVSGEIVAVLVENGQPVEYGEPLFKIRLREPARV
ncbi:MAG TPA: acetyl-CoA carboxylase biotin carboxyl carrier protein [Acidobacteriota bacterium]|nr:acetyl-CoA carboxylase biotin carboxyl carrier protein [Acidobacteriota bacterium]HRV06928.1 acetyl-CoA carboxylase biotin carboxyl carrier protein [Acidobacteriota bacterium]